MTPNKQIVNEYMEAFRVSDHKRILDCLTDDIIWEMPGIYQHVGKEEFDKEIENENFVGSPTIQIFKLIEENNTVIAEGAVQGNMTNGGKLDAVFCDVFEMENGKIKKLTSYLMSKNANLKFE
ncbi:nuclear transport factor 2 family protein [Flavobacterium sp. H4147]|uniref:nuclear transport factor 2 family protein n=1 Tax=Flavobacterium sp. H4147 TaxID=3034149 RepID=UPI0023ECD232|nr:nuclear transport factor 2 family protein [Flavobacterium sp. H4147]